MLRPIKLAHSSLILQHKTPVWGLSTVFMYGKIIQRNALILGVCELRLATLLNQGCSYAIAPNITLITI